LRINSYCEVESSILMHEAEVGRYKPHPAAPSLAPALKIPSRSVMIGY